MLRFVATLCANEIAALGDSLAMTAGIQEFRNFGILKRGGRRDQGASPHLSLR